MCQTPLNPEMKNFKIILKFKTHFLKRNSTEKKAEFENPLRNVFITQMRAKTTFRDVLSVMSGFTSIENHGK